MRILLVEDDVKLTRVIRRVLQGEGWLVDAVGDGASAVTAAGQSEFDLIILDVRLPVMTGIQVSRVLRESGNATPILMLTALGEVSDRVAGLDAGADDYLMKPFSFDELLARIRALTRRRTEAGREPSVLKSGGLVLDLIRHEVTVEDRKVYLTPTEFRLLALLMRSPGSVLGRATILERVWGYAYDGDSAVVDTYVHYLRSKIDGEGRPSPIRTVRGVGYTLEQ